MWLQKFTSSKKVYHTILCNLTVSNIVIILVQSSIADGESFLVIFPCVFIFIRNNLSQSSHKKLSQPTFNFI